MPKAPRFGRQSRWLWVIVGLLCLVGSVDARANDTAPLWKSVGNWQIRVDQSLNYGCFMFTSYVGGDVIRIGFDRKYGKDGYVMIGNGAWHSLEAGKQYELYIRFDDDTPWRGKATGIGWGGGNVVFLYLPFNKSGVVQELAAETGIEDIYNDKVVATLSLSDSFAAVQDLIRCQETVEEAQGRYNRPDTTDPFAQTAHPGNRDPFAQ